MNVTKMRNLLRKRGPLAVPLVAGYFALHYAKRNKAKTALIVTGSGLGLALLSYGAGQIGRSNESLVQCGYVTKPNVSEAAAYTITDLGTLGGSFSQASALNNRGQVAGTSTTKNGDAHGYVWQNGKMTDMGTLGGDFSVTSALNNNGAAVGLSVDQDEEYINAFAWRDGKMSRVLQKSEQISVATGINDSGAIVGISQDKQERVWGFARKGDKLLLFRLKDSDFTAVSAINVGGSIAGFGFTNSGIKAFTRDAENKFRDLPGLSGEDCFAEAINERGDAAGASFLNDTDTLHGVVWRDGKPIDLGTLPGLPDSLAFSINRDGAAVGAAYPPDEENESHFGKMPAVSRKDSIQRYMDILDCIKPTSRLWLDEGSALSDRLASIDATQEKLRLATAKNELPHAFIWRNGKITDLNKLLPSGSGWTLLIAPGINDKGQISGVGLHDGKVRAFLLSPK